METASLHEPLATIAPPGATIAKMSLNWDDLRFVLALRQAGSLGAAARLLKVEQSTASRRLCALEAALGGKLVVRTPEGLKFNAAGDLTADLAESIQAGILALERRVGGEDQKPEGLCSPGNMRSSRERSRDTR